MSSPVFHPEPAAGRIVSQILDEFFERSAAARTLSELVLEATGARLKDAIEVLSVPGDLKLEAGLAEAGFLRVARAERDEGTALWEHPAALFPLVELHTDTKLCAYVRVDSVVDFLEAAASERPLRLEGEAGSLVRRALVAAGANSELWVVERRAEKRLAASATAVSHGPGAAAIALHLERFRLRARPLGDVEGGFEQTLALVRDAQHELGEAVACELFFEAERQYYTRKNRAARLQKARQDAVGLGWFNRDHHTYRSSRAAFRSLVAVLEALGLVCRERFYAGNEAGWGAQVMEHEGVGICVFADVDLSPAEVSGDFAHRSLEPQAALGTVGLWCELHGEAFLAAGMHHLECQFDFDAVGRQLRAQGVGVMAPFTDYSHLKQAFTEGETWQVKPERLESALGGGFLSGSQAERIAREGALGSHFELLERNDGFKGFNQAGINRIIQATDPRS